MYKLFTLENLIVLVQIKPVGEKINIEYDFINYMTVSCVSFKAFIIYLLIWISLFVCGIAIMSHGWGVNELPSVPNGIFMCKGNNA